MSILTFKTLKWDNCFSFGAGNELDLQASNLTQILGENGNGKSSIPLIIQEALYNKNSKKTPRSDVANREGDGTYSIELTFQKDSKEYVIKTRRKGATLTCNLFEDGTNISAHTSTNTFKLIENIVGLDFNTFEQLIYQNPKTSLQFLVATDTARKDFLIELFSLGEYTDIHALVKAKSDEVNREISILESGRLKYIDEWLKKNAVDITSPLPDLLPVPNEALSQEDNEKLLELELASIVRNNKDAAAYNKYSKEKEDIIASLANYGTTESHYIDTTELVQEKGRLNSLITQQNSVLTKLKGVNTHSSCPTCLQSIDVSTHTILSDEATRLVSQYTEELAYIQAKLIAAEDNNKTFKQRTTLEQKLAGLVEVPLAEAKDTKALEARLKEIKDTSITQIKQVQAVKAHNDRVISEKAKREIYLEQRDSLEKERAEIKTTLEILNKDSEYLNILKRAFSTNGLIAYKLENLVKELEVYTNAFLEELSEGRFDIAFVLENNKLNVVLRDAGTQVSITSVSSGELAKINISTLLAIRKLMSSISKNSINILFLDEVISVLDNNGKEKLIDVLLEEHDLTCFLVSHSWQHPLLAKLTVSKDNGFSYIGEF